MTGNERKSIVRRATLLRAMLAGYLLLAGFGSGIAQVGSCKDTEAAKLLALGARQIDSSGARFEIDGTQLSLVCNSAGLEAVEVTLGEVGSIKEYDRAIALVGQMKSLGKFLRNQPIAVIGPSGWETSNQEFSGGYIVRRKRTCDGDQTDCGIKEFTVFYWIPFRGKVEAKRLERLKVKGFINQTRYFLTVAGREVRVSPSKYRQVRKGQLVEVETTLANGPARVHP